MSATPTDEERAAVDALLGSPASGWDGGDREGDTHRVSHGGHAVRGQRHLLLPALHALQGSAGWISEGGLTYVCERLSVPPAEAYGVASFYAMFSMESRPRTVVHVCDDLACRIGGAKELCQQLETTVGPEGAPIADGRATWHRSPCLGMCEQAPAVLAQRTGAPDVSLGGASVETFHAMVARGSSLTCA